MLADFFVYNGGQQLIVFLLPLVAGLTVLGGLKAAQVAAGPLQIAIAAANVIAIPSVARLSREEHFDLAMRRGLQLSAAVFSFGLIYTAVLVAIPLSVGTDAFGASWSNGSQIAGYIGLQCAFSGVAQGALVVLRGTGSTGRGLVVRLWLTPINILVPLAGAALGGLRGLGIAMAATSILALIVWWGAARHTVNLKSRPQVSQEEELASEHAAILSLAGPELEETLAAEQAAILLSLEQAEPPDKS
jgi:O-antigen/teichoic acid export membrane protein